MKITGHKLEIGGIEKDIYGLITIGTLHLDVDGWMSNDGPIDYTESIKITWNGEDFSGIIFKTDTQAVDADVKLIDNSFHIVIKINESIVIARNAELPNFDTDGYQQTGESIYI